MARRVILSDHLMASGSRFVRVADVPETTGPGRQERGMGTERLIFRRATREQDADPPGRHLSQPPVHAPNAALLIDFDNVTLGVQKDLTKELRTLLNSDIIKGKVAVQRAYADWRRYRSISCRCPSPRST